ncbi:Plasmodium vivax Vir protein, putative [Plasmodium vivax]|uniref:Vir protein, putative n=1 Tax=Plasmodium vivax TaxID=5855 RepID=A0A1G4EA89_PLAVI|nr:Plasmodium vivax Vir protein, putative [Plasmodium vivax]
MKSKFNGYEDLYELCKMFEKNLSELPIILREETDNNEKCRYLIFWLNDQMRKMFNSYNILPNIKNSIMQGFYSLTYRTNPILLKNKCKYIYDNDIDLDLWKNWKDLYDYIRNKDNIRAKIESNKILCKTYQEYNTHITRIYENYKKECCEKKYGNCPHYLNFKEWCDKDNILIELECTEPAELGESRADDSRVIAEKTGLAEDEEPGRGQKKERTPGQGAGERVVAVGGLEVKVKEGQEAGSPGDTLDSIIYTGLPSSEDNEETTKGNETNPVGTIVGTSLGFVLPLITIYRFTPLGSWINTKIFRKDRLMENMKINERELLLNSSGIGETNFDNTRYQIMYNSAHNE